MKLSSFSLMTLLITISLLSSLASAYSIDFIILIKECQKYAYNYTMLVLNWPSEFCYHHQTCKPNWKELILGNQWVIRGFWPASNDVDFLNCIQYEGHDPNCLVDYPYNDTTLNPALKVQLNTYWPEITTSNDIKSDQWEEHGTCYVSVLQTLNSSQIGKEAQIFESYFRSPIQKYKQLKLNLTLPQYKNKNELAQAIGVKPEQFHALCEYDADYLSQLRLCYNIKGTPGSEVLTSCPNELPNECEFPAKIRNSSSSEKCLQFIGVAFLIIIALLI